MAGIYKNLNYKKEWNRNNREHKANYLNNWHKRNPKKAQEYNLRRLYKLSIEELEELKRKQDFKCAICEKEKQLCVDHDHKTGRLRGLLCKPCNLALGNLGDTETSILKVLAYLKEYGNNV